jgi:hypothetical protein
MSTRTRRRKPAAKKPSQAPTNNPVSVFEAELAVIDAQIQERLMFLNANDQVLINLRTARATTEGNLKVLTGEKAAGPWAEQAARRAAAAQNGQKKPKGE